MVLGTLYLCHCSGAVNPEEAEPEILQPLFPHEAPEAEISFGDCLRTFLTPALCCSLPVVPTGGTALSQSPELKFEPKPDLSLAAPPPFFFWWDTTLINYNQLCGIHSFLCSQIFMATAVLYKSETIYFVDFFFSHMMGLFLRFLFVLFQRSFQLTVMRLQHAMTLGVGAWSKY